MLLNVSTQVQAAAEIPLNDSYNCFDFVNLLNRYSKYSQTAGLNFTFTIMSPEQDEKDSSKYFALTYSGVRLWFVTNQSLIYNIVVINNDNEQGQAKDAQNIQFSILLALGFNKSEIEKALSSMQVINENSTVSYVFCQKANRTFQIGYTMKNGETYWLIAAC